MTNFRKRAYYSVAFIEEQCMSRLDDSESYRPEGAVELHRAHAYIKFLDTHRFNPGYVFH